MTHLFDGHTGMAFPIPLGIMQERSGPIEYVKVVNSHLPCLPRLVVGENWNSTNVQHDAQIPTPMTVRIMPSTLRAEGTFSPANTTPHTAVETKVSELQVGTTTLKFWSAKQ